MKWPEDKLTRFETARLIGARSLQIALGAPTLKKVEGSIDSTKVAKEEFFEKLLPMTIKRKFPNGEESVVKLKAAIDRWISERNKEV